LGFPWTPGDEVKELGVEGGRRDRVPAFAGRVERTERVNRSFGNLAHHRRLAGTAAPVAVRIPRPGSRSWGTTRVEREAVE